MEQYERKPASQRYDMMEDLRNEKSAPIQSALEKHAQLFAMLDEQLAPSTLNTLLIELFHRKTQRMRPADLLRAYTENRFVKPSDASFERLQQVKTNLTLAATEAGFEALTLSPVCPLGACAAVGPTHQNNVLSALRGVEVVADATNVLALESAVRRKKNRPISLLNLCTSHRHVRTQVFNFEGFTPHFDIFCMTSAGRDNGHYAFECEAARAHLGLYFDFFQSLPGCEGFRAECKVLSKQGLAFTEALGELDFPFTIKPFHADAKEGYYRLVQIKMYAQIKGREWEFGDSGFTNWTARLLEDRKERFFISGLGIELLARALAGN